MNFLQQLPAALAEFSVICAVVDSDVPGQEELVQYSHWPSQSEVLLHHGFASPSIVVQES